MDELKKKKKMLIDFINYSIIAAFFLVMPYTIESFLTIIFSLICYYIMLYITERRGD